MLFSGCVRGLCDYIRMPGSRSLGAAQDGPTWSDVVRRLVGRPYSKATADRWATVSHWLIEGMPIDHEGAEGWTRTLLSDQQLSPECWESWYRGVPFLSVRDSGFTFIDLFAGIGGFRLALQDAGGRCVFSSEWDTSARATYGANFGEIPFGDIRLYSGDHIPLELVDALVPDHDVIAAGFPCQPFSAAGVSARNSVGKPHGFRCDTQGTLFHDIMRIVDAKSRAGRPPRVLLLENVRNLQRHDSGRTFAIIKESIQGRGYSFHWAILDSQYLVSQRRQRCYMVAVHEDVLTPFEMPTIEGTPQALSQILEPYSADHEQFRISDSLWAGHIARSARNSARGTGFTAGLADTSKPANTLVARYCKDGKECLIEDVPGKSPRMLTPDECRRLQGYPEAFILPESKAAAYRQFGNSVTLPVVRRVVEQLQPILATCGVYSSSDAG
jgi:DNA (cytosine-5)-methyltransferase 1